MRWGQFSLLSKEAGIKSMLRAILVWRLTAILLVTASLADAQPMSKIPRIGFLSRRSAPTLWHR
jgi:hypothetical protein